MYSYYNSVLGEEKELFMNDQEHTNEKVLTKKAKIIIASVISVLCICYICIAVYFGDRFFWGTTVNGMDCSGKTVEDVEKDLQSQVEQYVLKINGTDGSVEEITGSDIESKYINGEDIQKAFEMQKPYLWPVSLFRKQNIETEVAFSYNQEALDKKIAQLECMKEENQIKPVSATLEYKDGQFTVKKEVPGTQIDEKKIYAVIHESVGLMEDVISLEEKGCYVSPAYTAESEKVIASQKELNKYLAAKITYSLDSIEVTVDKDEIAKWVSVNKDMNPVISEKRVRAFTDTLGDKYNTPNKSKTLVTPTGKEVTISGAILGRIVGSAAECEQLMKEIKEGKTVTREPIFSQKATSEGQYSWGNTYVEVDIAQQHMWYISNGSVVFEADVVTGSPGRDTPTGVFKILEKLRGKTLRGNRLPNGELEYETPVDYWARVTWSGVGFHDATWQEAFGGQRYKEGYGSHGCINMSMSDVTTFYNMISVGDPVIIHY